MKIRNLILLFSATLLAALSCKEKGAPEMIATYIDTDVAQVSVPAAECVAVVNVKSDGYWAAEVPDWIIARPAIGYGDNRLTLTFSRNAEEDSKVFNHVRTADLTLRGNVIKSILPILQGGEVSLSEFLAQEDDENVYWQVTGSIKSIEDNEFGRITITDGSSEVLVYNIVDEAGHNKKFSSMNLFKDDKVTLYGFKSSTGKDALGNPVPYLFDARVLDTDFQGFSISTGRHSSGFEGDSFEVTIYEGSSVTATCDKTWVHIGTISDGKVTITVDENPVYDARSAEVVFKSGSSTRSVHISQDAHPAYQFLLSSKGETVAKTAGSVSFSVHAASAVAWKVTLGEGLECDRKEGHGPAVVTVDYPANPGLAFHEYTVKVSTNNEFAVEKEHTFTISQEPVLYAKWLLNPDDCVHFQYDFGCKSLGTYTRDVNPGDGGLFAPANNGEGRVTYVQIDKRNLSGAAGVSGRTVDKNGKFCIAGGYKGDYWYITVGDGKSIVPSGTKILVSYTTATSAGGLSIGLAQYSEDGTNWIIPTDWRKNPDVHTLKTLSAADFPNVNELDLGVQYNCVQTAATALLEIQYVITLSQPVTSIFIKQEVMASLNTNYDDRTGSTNSGTYRLTGDDITVSIIEE